LIVPLSIPSPPQGVWHLGPFPIRAYALCILAGIGVAVWMGERRWKARGGAPGVVESVSLWMVPFGIVGGRLYHVATDPELYFTAGRNPWNAFKIWDGGLGIWGAVLLGGVGALIGARRAGVPLPSRADAIAPASRWPRRSGGGAAGSTRDSSAAVKPATYGANARP
jgi:prolipoprotein diacylglyceryltransferase